ncbi:organic hydroperoxide resistance protein [Uliginosibacterium sp. H1]|uniref:organic hydroperoxide resistance protein n=1 Tax=Uliginosibacterium sp. H1 TaxID=3114757 RepID=UPI002E18BF46|nr:organic hydroperoxide resistance protein [Uliginosibacterium sp. H1]
MKAMKTLYTARAKSTGGREGKSATDDGKLSLNLSVPKGLGGDDGPGTNPEQLFACGYSACFLGALRFVAGKAGVAVPPEASVAAAVSIGARDDGSGFSIEAALTITVPGVERATVEKLVEQAHIVCPYSDATRGNIKVTLTVA